MRHKAFLSTWFKTFWHAIEQEVFEDVFCTKPKKNDFKWCLWGLTNKRNKIDSILQIGKSSRYCENNVCSNTNDASNFFGQCLDRNKNIVKSVGPYSSCMVTMAILTQHWVVNLTDCHQKKSASVKITFLKPSHSLDAQSTGVRRRDPW